MVVRPSLAVSARSREPALTPYATLKGYVTLKGETRPSATGVASGGDHDASVRSVAGGVMKRVKTE